MFVKMLSLLNLFITTWPFLELLLPLGGTNVLRSTADCLGVLQFCCNPSPATLASTSLLLLTSGNGTPIRKYVTFI
jgi:hypothetical protein